METAKHRLTERHLRSGICRTKEEAEQRAIENDLDNGTFILAHIKHPIERIVNE
jgi:hypothetical protein